MQAVACLFLSKKAASNQFQSGEGEKRPPRKKTRSVGKISKREGESLQRGKTLAATSQKKGKYLNALAKEGEGF